MAPSAQLLSPCRLHGTYSCAVGIIVVSAPDWPLPRSGSGRECAVEAISDFIHQPPGCRQGTSLEPVAWHYCPAAKRGPFGPWEFWIDDATPWSRRSVVAARRLARSSTHGQSRRARVTARTAVTACSPRSRHARSGHGTHATITARTHRSRHTQQTWRALFNHGARVSDTARATVTACTSRSLHVRTARQALWTGRAQRPRQRD